MKIVNSVPKCPRCFQKVNGDEENCLSCGQSLYRHTQFPAKDEIPIHCAACGAVLKNANSPCEDCQKPVQNEICQSLHEPSRIAKPAAPTSFNSHPRRDVIPTRRILAIVATAIVGLLVIASFFFFTRPSGDSFSPELVVDATGSPHTLVLTEQQLTAEDRQRLSKLTQLRKLMADKSTIDDGDLEAVGKMTGLRWLYLRRANISDAGLQQLRDLKYLERLHLYGTPVTDAGLANLRELTELKELGLSRTQVTDVGLRHLRGLTNLQNLGLARTKITDAGLVHLRPLANLKRVDVRYTEVTDEGVSRFQAAHPDCEIKS